MVDCALKATLASRQLWCRATGRGDVSVFNCEMGMGQGSVWGIPKCEVFWLVSFQLCFVFGTHFICNYFTFHLAHISLDTFCFAVIGLTRDLPGFARGIWRGPASHTCWFAIISHFTWHTFLWIHFALQLLVWQEISLDLPGGYEEGQHHTHVDSAHAGAIEILNVVDSPCPKLHFHMDGSCQSSCCRFVLFSGTMIWVCCSQLFCDCQVVFAYGVHSRFCWVVKCVL